MLQRIFICVFIALSGFPMASGAAAQRDAEGFHRDRDMVVSTVTLDDMRLLLDDMGARYTAAGVSSDGAPFVFGTTGSGMSFAIYSICGKPNGEDCKGIEFLAVFGSGRSDKTIGRLDQAYAAVSIYKPDEKTVHVSRYMILDYGVTWGNVIENARVFGALCDRVMTELSMGPDVAKAGGGG